MKTKLFTLFLALVASVGTMFASDIQVNGIWYNFDWRTETATVTFEGSSGFTYPNEYTGEVVIPAFVTYEGTTYSVTSIGSSAFSGCSSLTSVTIPNSVTSIGGSAFYECSNLTSVTIGNSVTSIGSSAFYRCSSLTSVTIGNSVTSIGRSAFFSCSSLTSVTIPNSVTSIGEEAFRFCSSLTSVTIPNSVTSIGDYAFHGCSGLTSVTIPNGVTSIGDDAFYGCSGLTSVTIPNSVTSIGRSAFSSCTALTSVMIGSNVGTIGEYAFNECENIESVVWNAKNCDDFHYTEAPFYYIRTQITSFTFGDSVNHIPSYLCYEMDKLRTMIIPGSSNNVTIGQSAFYGCSSLTSVVFPYNLTGIGVNAFSQCKNLTSLDIPESITSIGEYAFSGCTNLISVSIGNSLTSIVNNVFSSCSNITNIIAPAIAFNTGLYTSKLQNAVVTSGVLNENGFSYINTSHKTLKTLDISTSTTTILADQGLKDCYSLENLYLPASMEQIGYEAFSGCYALRGITLPESLVEIGNKAFNGCDNLELIVSNAVAPPTIGNAVFDNRMLTAGTLRVPCGSRNVYAASAWGNYFSNITENYVFNISITANNESMGEVTFDLDCENNQATIIATANEGYRFVQWSDGSQDASRVITLIQDTLLVALFEAIPSIEKFAVYFLDWDGSLLSEQKVESGNVPLVPEEPEREGFRFTGWSANLEAITERTFAIAQYEKESVGVPVYFVDAENNLISTSHIADMAPDAPFLADKSFIGWKVLEGNIAEGVVVQATYEGDAPQSLPSIEHSEAAPQKILRNGQVFILRGYKTYSVTGQEVK